MGHGDGAAALGHRSGWPRCGCARRCAHWYSTLIWPSCVEVAGSAARRRWPGRRTAAAGVVAEATAVVTGDVDPPGESIRASIVDVEAAGHDHLDVPGAQVHGRSSDRRGPGIGHLGQVEPDLTDRRRSTPAPPAAAVVGVDPASLASTPNAPPATTAVAASASDEEARGGSAHRGARRPSRPRSITAVIAEGERRVGAVGDGVAVVVDAQGPEADGDQGEGRPEPDDAGALAGAAGTSGGRGGSAAARSAAARRLGSSRVGAARRGARARYAPALRRIRAAGPGCAADRRRGAVGGPDRSSVPAVADDQHDGDQHGDAGTSGQRVEPVERVADGEQDGDAGSDRAAAPCAARCRPGSVRASPVSSGTSSQHDAVDQQPGTAEEREHDQQHPDDRSGRCRSAGRARPRRRRCSGWSCCGAAGPGPGVSRSAVAGPGSWPAARRPVEFSFMSPSWCPRPARAPSGTTLILR